MNPNQLVFLMQIVSGSMILGVLIFLGIILIINQGQQPKDPLVTYIALGFAGLAIVGQALVRLPVDSSQLEQTSKDHRFDPQSEAVYSVLAPVCQVEHIVKMAILEAAALFNGIAYMLETIWWSLAAMGVIVFLMLIQFPSQSRINAWIERRTIALQFGASDF